MSGAGHDCPHPLDELIGEDLACVGFLSGWVQLQFGNDRLNVYIWPLLHRDGAVRQHGEPGYNDALIGAIGMRLTAVDELPELGLVLDLANGATRLTIPLGDSTELEIVEFWGKRGGFVWRTGHELITFPPRS